MRVGSGRHPPYHSGMAESVEVGGLDPHDCSLLTTTLAMTVDQRLQRLIDYVRFVDAGRAAMQAAMQ